MFVANTAWQLRQFGLKIEAVRGSRLQTGVSMIPLPVSDSPLPDLFKPAAAGESATIAGLRAEFWNYFSTSGVAGLISPDVSALATNNTPQLTDKALVTGMVTKIPDRFSGFESTSFDSSGGQNHNTQAIIAPELRARVDVAVASTPLMWGTNPTQVINRAGVGTCGGCHVPISTNIAPSSVTGMQIHFPNARFTHIDSLGDMSPHLRGALPDRFNFLQQFIAIHSRLSHHHSTPVLTRQQGAPGPGK